MKKFHAVEKSILKCKLKTGFVLSIAMSSLHALGKACNCPQLPFLYIIKKKIKGIELDNSNYYDS